MYFTIFAHKYHLIKKKIITGIATVSKFKKNISMITHIEDNEKITFMVK